MCVCIGNACSSVFFRRYTCSSYVLFFIYSFFFTVTPRFALSSSLTLTNSCIRSNHSISLSHFHSLLIFSSSLIKERRGRYRDTRVSFFHPARGGRRTKRNETRSSVSFNCGLEVLSLLLLLLSFLLTPPSGSLLLFVSLSTLFLFSFFFLFFILSFSLSSLFFFLLPRCPFFYLRSRNVEWPREAREEGKEDTRSCPRSPLFIIIRKCVIRPTS